MIELYFYLIGAEAGAVEVRCASAPIHYLYIERKDGFSSGPIPLSFALLFYLLRVERVIAACRFFLAINGKIGYALQVADHTRQVVYIMTVTVRTLLQVALIDVPTLVTKCVRDVKREVIAPLFSCHAKQLAILRFAQVLIQIHVERRTAR